MSLPAQPPAGRYGPAPDPGRRRRVVVALWAAGIAGLAGALWLGAGAASTPVRWQDIGFEPAADRVAVVYDVVRRDPSRPVRCTVQALNQRYAQVGVVDVDVPASTERAVRLRTVVRTSEPAVTGVVEGCRLVEP